MGTVTLTVPSAGSPVTAASVANPLNTLKNEINGNLDNNNIKAAANIGWTKISKTGSAVADIADTNITSVARGDVLYRNNASKWANLAIGASGAFLKSDGTDPSWATIALDDLSDVTLSSVAQGDILYRGASAWQNLAKGTDGQVLKLASGVPSWANSSTALQSLAATPGNDSMDSGGAYQECGNGTDGRVTIVTTVECKFAIFGYSTIVPNTNTGRSCQLKGQVDTDGGGFADISSAFGAAVARQTDNTANPQIQFQGVTSALAAGTHIFRMMIREVNGGRAGSFTNQRLLVIALPTGN